MDSTQPEIDICIVGAGLSGLTAAYKILSKESTLKVIILEGGDKIGGELQSSSLGELGGKWITPDQYHVYDLCRKLNVPITRREKPPPNLQRSWEIDRGFYGALARFEVQRLIGRINLLSAQFYPGAFKLSKDDMTMEDFISSQLLFEQSRQFMRCFIRFIAGVEATDISYSEFMSICEGSGDLSELIALLTGTSSMTLEFSSEQLLSKLEKEIGSYYIFLNSKVTEVVHYVNYALVRDDRNNVFRTNVLIIAVPWQISQRIVFYPPIPQELRTPLFESKYMMSSFLIQYPENHWRKKGFSGSLILHNPHMICYEYRPNVYGGLVAHEEDFDKILQPVILNRLSQVFGAEMGIPANWLQKTWEQPAVLNLPTTTPWNHIIWGSTTAATSYRGCLSGAVQSGYRSAVHALLILRPQNIGWQDINEIGKAAAVRPRHSSLKLFLSSLNLYNTSVYAGVAGMVYVSYKLLKGVKRSYFG